MEKIRKAIEVLAEMKTGDVMKDEALELAISSLSMSLSDLDTIHEENELYSKLQ